MIGEFTSYSPDLWTESGLVLHKVSPAPVSSKRGENRSNGWFSSTERMPLGVIGGAVVAVMALTLFVGPTATSFDHQVQLPQTHRSKHDPVLSPLKEINRNFNTLFASINAGTSLIPTTEMRLLASSAASLRHETVDVQQWASRLASDIKDAAD